VTLDHFVMVRIHARQPIDYQELTQIAIRPITSCYPFVIRFSGFTHPSCSTCADNCAHFAWPGSGQIYNRLSLFLMKRANNKTNSVPLPDPLTEEDSPGEDAE